MILIIIDFTFRKLRHKGLGDKKVIRFRPSSLDMVRVKNFQAVS